MKKSRVDIKNCHYTVNEEENNNLHKKLVCEAENDNRSCWESTSSSSDTQFEEKVSLCIKSGNSYETEESRGAYVSSLQTSSPVISVPAKSITSLPYSVPVPSTSAASASPLSNHDPSDDFSYQCPFPGCFYYTDYTGMKTGSAARHGRADHHISPTEFKTRGLKWRRASRMKLLKRGVGATS